MTEFVSGPRLVWEALAKAFGHGVHAHVAVAFVGSRATSLMKLAPGSVLVVNISDDALRTGQTNPHVLETFRKNGVRVYGNDTLHAKVFVFARSAYVGSSNASARSASRLIEAVVRTTDSDTVKEARAFVRSVAEREIGPEELKALKEKYRPPQYPLFGGKSNHTREFIWCIDIDETGYSPAAETASDLGLPKARRKLRDSKRFKIDEFQWMGRRDLNRIANHQEVLRRIQEGRSKYVYPLATIVHREGFRDGRSDSEIIFLEVPKARKKIPWSLARRRFRGLFGGNGVVKTKSAAQIRLIREKFGSALKKK